MAYHEEFLSHYLYYAMGLIVCLYTRSIARSTIVVIFFFHIIIYNFSIQLSTAGGERTNKMEFRAWLPITAFIGMVSAYIVGQLVNFRRLIFVSDDMAQYGCWMLAILPFQLLMLGATLVIWETEDLWIRPLTYLCAGLGQMIFIVMAAVAWGGHSVFSYREEGTDNLLYDDFAGPKFYGTLFVYLLSSTLVFGIIRWLAPSFWPFWIALLVFGLHLIFSAIIGLVPSSEGGRLYGEARKTVLRTVGQQKDVFSAEKGETEAELRLLNKGT